MGTATRNTVQRGLVLEAVRSLDHPSSSEVHGIVSAAHPNISRATVYRNLHLLSERGEIRRIAMPEGADRYDFNVSPHYHVACTACGKVADVELPHRRGIEDEVRRANGFIIFGYTIVFEGLCPACQREPA